MVKLRQRCGLLSLPKNPGSQWCQASLALHDVGAGPAWYPGVVLMVWLWVVSIFCWYCDDEYRWAAIHQRRLSLQINSFSSVCKAPVCNFAIAHDTGPGWSSPPQGVPSLHDVNDALYHKNLASLNILIQAPQLRLFEANGVPNYYLTCTMVYVLKQSFSPKMSLYSPRG